MQIQLSLFDIKHQEKKQSAAISKGDHLMLHLELLAQMAEAQNKMLQSIIDELQADWTDEQKLQVNNPKEYERQQNIKQQKNSPMPEFTAEAIEVLKNSTVQGTVVKLPVGQLDRKIYVEVKNKLELIGGKWKGGKVYGFEFQEDPTNLLNEIANGEHRDLKKEFQFFATPDELADYLVELAFIGFGIQEEQFKILEPSAGQGAIVKAINRRTGNENVFCYEAMPLNRTFLNKISTVVMLGEDFMQAPDSEQYNIIIANPPFTKNTDIDHIRKMYSILAPGGRMVSISSKSWQTGSQKKQIAFKEWIDEIGASVEEIEPGAFKESGTSVGGLIITINK